MTNLLVLTAILFQAPELPTHENGWSDWLISGGDNAVMKGEREYALPDGRRIDIFDTSGPVNIAYEVDWCDKWPEGIGQALGYAVASNSDPGLVLLVGKDEDEYYNAALAVITDLRRRGYKFHLVVVNTETGKVWKL